VKIGPVDPEIALLNLKKKKEINASKIYSASGKFAEQSKNETRNAWQSLVYSPLGAVVSPLLNTCEKHLLTDHLSA